MKVYLVSDGCYSDYSIRGVFSTAELAESYRAVLAGDDSDSDAAVVEWEVDAEAGKVWRPCFRASINLSAIYHVFTGEVICEAGAIYNEDEGMALATPDARSKSPEALGAPHRPVLGKPPSEVGPGGARRVCSLVSAEHARKLAVEARQAWLRSRVARSEE